MSWAADRATSETAPALPAGIPQGGSWKVETGTPFLHVGLRGSGSVPAWTGATVPHEYSWGSADTCA